MPDNAILKFQGELIEGTQLQEVVQDDGIYLAAPETPGLGIGLVPEVAGRTRVDA